MPGSPGTPGLSMDRNAALRAEVKRLHTLTTKKVSRIKRVTGARVSGTSYDPRIDTRQLRGMNARELRKYERKLESFLSRGTQFVSGYMKKPIPRKSWLAYKLVEQEANKKIEHFYSRIKDIRLPGQFKSFTVEDYRNQRTPKHPHMQNPAANVPGALSRTPRSVEYESRLRELTQEMGRRGSDKWWQDKINQGREQYGMMTEAMGRPDLFEKAMVLSDEQFALLFFATPFMENASLNYETAMKMFDHTERPYLEQAAKQKESENEGWLEWAAKQEF